ncbi:ABC transporter substrate-binding protein [Paraglaciecola sp. Hal342]
MYKYLSFILCLTTTFIHAPVQADVSASTSDKGAAQSMRIIASGGSITEVIYALGKEQYLVATDSTSLYPAEAAALPKLGYFRQLSTEGILGFAPTHLFGAQATGPETLATQLESAGIKVHIFTEQRDLSGLQQMISEMGQLLDTPNKAQALNTQIEQQVAKLKYEARIRSQDSREKQSAINALFVMSDSDRGLTVAGEIQYLNLCLMMLALSTQQKICLIIKSWIMSLYWPPTQILFLLLAIALKSLMP